MSIKEAQINVRLPADLDTWVEDQAGGKRQKPAFVRQLIERERARAEEAALQAMFDQAWDGLPEQEREAVRAEREEWFRLYARPKKS
jgi:hypothetical protein